MKTLLSLIVLFFTVYSLHAQAPQFFNYQAVVRNNVGNVVPDKDLAMRISILQDAFDGPDLYIEGHQVATNTFGLVSLAIGSGNPESGLFESIQWGNGLKFIRIEVDVEKDGSYDILGVQQLLSVPYALYAEKTGETRQYIAGEGLTIAGDTIQNTSPSVWSNGMNANQIHYSLGDVGIGTANPARLFHIDAGDDDGLFPQSGFAIMGGGNTATLNGLNTNLIFGRTTAKEGTMWLQAFHSGSSPDDDWRLALNPSIGYVGVGTYTPKSKLQVTGGDIYVSSITSGIVLRSSNGSCFKIIVDNAGQLVTQSISCP
ncbi:MAG: hypothetical protein KA479_09145 [Saprospiraceae bacterium]|nr:hypothetical protein [Saprospiraceae bacterium]